MSGNTCGKRGTLWNSVEAGCVTTIELPCTESQFANYLRKESGVAQKQLNPSEPEPLASSIIRTVRNTTEHRLEAIFSNRPVTFNLDSEDLDSFNKFQKKANKRKRIQRLHEIILKDSKLLFLDAQRAVRQNIAADAALARV